MLCSFAVKRVQTVLDLFPLNALLGVLQFNTHGLQLVTDAVSLGPVLGGASGLTVGDHLLHLLVQALLLPAVQQTQYIGELMDHVQASLRTSLGGLVFVGGGDVDGAHQLEQDGDGVGGVETSSMASSNRWR